MMENGEDAFRLIEKSENRKKLCLYVLVSLINEQASNQNESGLSHEKKR